MVAAAVDINIQAQEMEKLREELNGILAKTSGQPLDKIQQDTDRDLPKHKKLLITDWLTKLLLRYKLSFFFQFISECKCASLTGKMPWNFKFLQFGLRNDFSSSALTDSGLT